MYLILVFYGGYHIYSITQQSTIILLNNNLKNFKVNHLFFIINFNNIYIPGIRSLKFDTNVGYNLLYCTRENQPPPAYRSVRVAERLALSTSDHGVAGSNPAGGEILPELKRRFIAQSLLCSPFHRLEMTEILLKGRKTLTHPSILLLIISHYLSIFLSRQ